MHADLDAFYASVEQRDDPRLRGRPMYVGPGVVLAASYEARAFGLRSGMGARRARRLCPQAIAVEARWEAYSEASRAVYDIFIDTAPTVEKISIDEAFLDVAGLDRISGSPARIATRLRRGCARRWGCRSRSAWPPRSCLRRSPATRASPTACWWCPPARARVPPPAEGRQAVGRRPGDRAQPRAVRHQDRSATRRERRSRTWLRSWAAPAGAGCTRWRTTATRGRSGTGRSRRSFGSQSARNFSTSSPRRASRRCSRRWSIA